MEIYTTNINILQVKSEDIISQTIISSSYLMHTVFEGQATNNSGLTMTNSFLMALFHSQKQLFIEQKGFVKQHTTSSETKISGKKIISD